MFRLVHFATGLAIAAVATAGIVTADAGSAPKPSVRPAVLIAHGDDRLPSATATDWVTYADHVVVVSAISEQAMQPTRIETERGEGLIGRTVGLTVEDVLWSRNGASHPAPRHWTYNATGWIFSDGKPAEKTVVAMENQPRIESGHQYILAITWEGPRCTPGDAPEPGRWMGLGEGSVLPFDRGVIGQGENEGRLQDATEAAAVAPPFTELEDKLVGKGRTSLITELNLATPEARPHRARTSTTCG